MDRVAVTEPSTPECPACLNASVKWVHVRDVHDLWASWLLRQFEGETARRYHKEPATH